MPRKILKNFSVSWLQVLDESGNIDTALLSDTQQFTEKTLRSFYESMVLIRSIDEKALNL